MCQRERERKRRYCSQAPFIAARRGRDENTMLHTLFSRAAVATALLMGSNVVTAIDLDISSASTFLSSLRGLGCCSGWLGTTY